jgi:hypothetical protein
VHALFPSSMEMLTGMICVISERENCHLRARSLLQLSLLLCLKIGTMEKIIMVGKKHIIFFLGI